MTDATLRHSLLDDRHRAAGGRMVPFGGWDMPLRYGSVLEEHMACRQGAVVFDVSHLGSVWVRGEGALAALQGLLTNDLTKIGPGGSQYTHLLSAEDASVVDDIIVWWVTDVDFLVIPNASNTAPARAALATAAAAERATVEDVTGSRSLLAVQGPEARARLSTVFPDAAKVARLDVGWDGDILVGGTGYTGEDGVELFVRAGREGEVWDALVNAGITPAGLGARDTLRLEMGYPLHGHELGPGITPLQAGLGWVVGWDKPGFQGRAALAAEKAQGVSRRLTGVLLEDRQLPRDGCTVLIDGEPAGTVTSGNLSPVLGRGVALAFLPPKTPPGTVVQVDIRGRTATGQTVKPPFVKGGL